MGRPDVVIAHTDSARGAEIRSRLLRAGFDVSESPGDLTGIRNLDPMIALVDARLLDVFPETDFPIIALAQADASMPLITNKRVESIVFEPLRGQEIEIATRVALDRRERDHYRALVEHTRHYALFMLDQHGVVRSWNPGAQSVYLYEAPEIVGRHFAVLYPEQDRSEGIPEAELRTAASEGFADDTRWLLRKNGELFWAEGLSTAVRNRRGDLIGFAKITRDATERRKLEQQLERSNDELQRFAYTVSHDLQEPLRTIRSYAELLSRRYMRQFDADGDEFIRFIMDAAGRMTQLLKDLLAYSQAGRPDRTTPQPTASANILQWAIMNVDGMIKETEATITYDPLPTVEADQTQLLQVFQNLLSNAIKYRSAEPPRIHISAVRSSDQYEFAVKDNGIGVDPQYHERVFGVFKRLHGKEVAGTGIGLAICRKIIESHEGRIWLESEPGQGTTVKFTLRAHD